MVLLYSRYGNGWVMPHHITEADRRRIKEFASTPKYKRSPRILEPDAEDVDDQE